MNVLRYAANALLYLKSFIQHPKKKTSGCIRKLREKIRNLLEYWHELSIYEIRHKSRHYYCKLVMFPAKFDDTSNCLVTESKWKTRLWCCILLGTVEIRILFLLAQPLMGNVSLKPIGSHSTVQRKEMDTVMFYIAAPYVLLGLVSINMIWMGATELLNIFNANVCIENRASVRYLKMDPAVGPLESLCKKYKIIKIAHVILSIFPIPTALAVGNVGLRHPESRMLIRSMLCSAPYGPCGWFWLGFDSVVTFYGTGLIVTVIGILGHGVMAVIACLIFANTNGLKLLPKWKLYAELQVFMHYINIPTRPLLTVCPTLIFFGIIMTNAAIPSIGHRMANRSLIMQTFLMLASMITTIITYKGFSFAELLHSESVELLKSFTRKSGNLTDGNGRKKIGRCQKFADRKRYFWLGRKPIAVQMGALGTMEDGHGIDFVQSVIQRTFDVVVLFQ